MSCPILIAEDDLPLNSLLTTWFRRASLDVHSVVDGRAAIEHAKRTRYSALFLDVMMPNVDGVGVLEYLREHNRSLLSRTVVMTAGGEAVRTRLAGFEVRAILDKPFDLREILEHAQAAAREVEEQKTVLIVDDDKAACNMMERPLRRRYRTLVVNDGARAVDIIRSEDIDFVLLDLKLPGMSGIEVIEYLREHHQYLLAHVVAVTVSPEMARDLPLAAVLRKPIDVSAIASTIEALRRAS